MSSPADTAVAIQKAMDPYIRPREEAQHIRRLLALTLRSCHEYGPQNSPMALADPDCIIKTTDTRGLQKDYLRALHRNIKAQRECETVSQQQAGYEPKGVKASGLGEAGRLENQVVAIKLRSKQERLEAIVRCLDTLTQRSAATMDLFKSEAIFGGSTRCRQVSKAVLSSCTTPTSHTQTDLRALVDRLEKTVLRSKYLHEKEEHLIEEVRSRATVSPGTISDGAKLTALNATRNELIAWIEAELGKASALKEPVLGDAHREVARAQLDEQLCSIRDKYAKLVAARRSLLFAESPQPLSRPSGEIQGAAKSETPPSVPLVYQIAPYIEKLFSNVHEQKASIAQKSHFNNVIAKQTDDTIEFLSHLADESQLLPERPNRGLHRGEGLIGKRLYAIVARAQPWASSADVAKLATLETVAEKVEQSQGALEVSMEYLAEIDQLVGRDAVGEGDASVDHSTADGMWIVETRRTRHKGSTAAVRSKDTLRDARDIWLLIDGNLGLINAEDSPRRYHRERGPS